MTSALTASPNGLTHYTSAIYVHFLDIYHSLRARHGNHARSPEALTEGRLAFRLAFLFSDSLFVPASSYYESPLARRVLIEHQELVRLGFIHLTAGESTLEEHRQSKLSQYDASSPLPLSKAYRRALRGSPPPYRQRIGSSTSGITKHWLSIMHDGNIPNKIETISTARTIERAWEMVPTELNGRAFIPDHVAPLLAQLGAPNVPWPILSTAIEAPYIHGYAQSLGVGLVTDLVYLQSPFPLHRYDGGISYAALCRCLSALDLLDIVRNCPVDNLQFLKMSSEWQVLASCLRASPTISEKVLLLAADAAKMMITQQALGKQRRSVKLDSSKQAKEGSITFGIVTALPIEFVAMKCLLSETKEIEIENDPNWYLRGSVPTKENRRHEIILTLLKRMGTNSASTAAASLLRSFPEVRVVVMTGIACAVPNPGSIEKHVRLGDIIVSDRRGVVQYDSMSLEDGVPKPRSFMPPPSAKMIDAVNKLEVLELEGKRPWIAYLNMIIKKRPRYARPPDEDDVMRGEHGEIVTHPPDPGREGRPIVFRGAIGSANILLRDAVMRKRIANEFDLRAIEMEGSGIAEATWQFSQSYLIVRGACDYGDKWKNSRWHGYAAAVAAAYTRALLEQISIAPR